MGLSIITLICGALAVALPIAALLFDKRGRLNSSWVVLLSAVLAMGSLTLVVWQFNLYGTTEDVRSFLDTVQAFWMCSVALMVLTTLANVFYLMRRR